VELDDLERNLEFLALFFSVPDRSFFEEIYAGRTPLGDLRTEETVAQFCARCETAVASLFVNSPQERPLYPLATEYVSEEAQKESLRKDLAALYESTGRFVVGYPPDHLKVIYEYLLHLLHQGRPGTAAEVYGKYVNGWIDQFSKLILDREVPNCIVQIAELMLQIGPQLEKRVSA
jgi:hypothetical protein